LQKKEQAVHAITEERASCTRHHWRKSKLYTPSLGQYLVI